MEHAYSIASAQLPALHVLLRHVINAFRVMYRAPQMHLLVLSVQFPIV